MYTAGKPARWTSRAVRPSYAPGATINPGIASNARKFAAAVIPTLLFARVMRLSHLLFYARKLR
jgi:hypothetical protein